MSDIKLLLLYKIYVESELKKTHKKKKNVFYVNLRHVTLSFQHDQLLNCNSMTKGLVRKLFFKKKIYIYLFIVHLVQKQNHKHVTFSFWCHCMQSTSLAINNLIKLEQKDVCLLSDFFLFV